MMRTIFCVMYLVLTVVVATPFGLFALLLGFLRLRRIKAAILHGTTHIWGRILILCTGCKLTVLGRENIPRSGGVCFVSNHGSMIDIPLLLACSGRVLGFVAKKELVWAPFFNLWILLLGGLFIDRKNPRKGLLTINKGIARIKNGGAMLIFPEGHRSRGKGLLPFHPGSLKLATHAETIIVPVAIKGSYDVYERHNRVTPVPIQVTFCSPINTADIPAAGRKLILSDQIYGVIQEALAKS